MIKSQLWAHAPVPSSSKEMSGTWIWHCWYHTWSRQCEKALWCSCCNIGFVMFCQCASLNPFCKAEELYAQNICFNSATKITVYSLKGLLAFWSCAANLSVCLSSTFISLLLTSIGFIVPFVIIGYSHGFWDARIPQQQCPGLILAPKSNMLAGELSTGLATIKRLQKSHFDFWGGFRIVESWDRFAKWF